MEQRYGQLEVDGGWAEVGHLPVAHLVWRLTSKQGLLYWAGLSAVWVPRCLRLFVFAMFKFVSAWMCKLQLWESQQNPTPPRSEVRPFMGMLRFWQKADKLGPRWHAPKGRQPLFSMTASQHTE